MSNFTLGNFSGLALDYSKSRPGYSPKIVSTLLALTKKKSSQVDFVDVGAGTGIWTRQVASELVNSCIAIEPNDDMRSYGELDSKATSVVWLKGSAEHTGLSRNSADLVTMASSFHWADFELSTNEFKRILRPGGIFAALWNPRILPQGSLFEDIEDHIKYLNPKINRVSSGAAKSSEALCERLVEVKGFKDLIYLEAKHEIVMSRDRYLSAWRSVNDLRVQLGEDGFEKFMSYVSEKTQDVSNLTALYRTRCWAVEFVG